MNRIQRILFAVTAVLFTVPSAEAQIVGSPGSELTTHPAAASSATASTAAAWRQGTGAWGETTVKKALRLRGYDEIYSPKLPGDRGIDVIAVKRGPTGRILDTRIVEVKTRRGYGRPRLHYTRHGRQMSPGWIRNRLNRLRTSSNPRYRNLARDLRAYRNARGISPNQMSEVIDINTRTGKYTIRKPGTRRVIARGNTKQLFRNLKSRAPRYTTRRWAAKNLKNWKSVRNRNMTGWVRGSARSGRWLPRRFTLKGITKSRIMRLAGPVAGIAVFALDVHESYAAIQSYRSGESSYEQMMRTQVEVGTGVAGAWAGSTAGAYAGAQLGALGGPFAPVSATAGSIVGGVTGGIAGYMAGRAAGAYAADAWYDRLDENVRNDLDHWVQNTSYAKTGLGTK